MKSLVLRALTASALAVAAAAQERVTEELPIGFLPNEWVAAALSKSLSPQGRSAFVSPTGPIRVTDAAGKIDAARHALRAFQQAPALVPIELSFSTLAQRTVQRLPVEPPVVERGIPVPSHYDPPRILAGPNGVTVIPSQPRGFSTRQVGPGTTVNPGVTGYATGEAEVRVTETGTTSTLARRYSFSTVPGKAVTATVQRAVADPAALRALALQRGAIAANEPAWTSAATELVVTPDLSDAALVVKVVPQIVLPPAGAGQPPRRIPLAACTAGVLVARGAQSQTGQLPKTDPEFYRVFLGTPQATDDTVTALNVTADVKYIGNPPK